MRGFPGRVLIRSTDEVGRARKEILRIRTLLPRRGARCVGEPEGERQGQEKNASDRHVGRLSDQHLPVQ